MKLFVTIVLIDLVLAMAVAGVLQFRRTASGFTITIETALLSNWYRTLKEAGAELKEAGVEFISNTFRRHSSDDTKSTRPCLNSRKN
jgi:hypothetical protein